MLQGKFLSHRVVSLAVLLVHTKGLTVAHQHFNGFHNLWFRRSYINLLCFCLCLTRAASITEVILATTSQFSYRCSRTFGGEEEENLALCLLQIQTSSWTGILQKEKGGMVWIGCAWWSSTKAWSMPLSGHIVSGSEINIAECIRSFQ